MIDADSSYDQNNYLFGAIYHDRVNEVDEALARGASDFEGAATVAAGRGNLDMLKMMINLGAVNYAIMAHHATNPYCRDVFEYLYVNHHHPMMNHYFDQAAYKGSVHILAFGFNIFENFPNYRLELNAEMLLLKSAEKGHTDCVELCILKGARNYDDGLRSAAINGHLGTFMLLYRQGVFNVYECLKLSIDNGHFNILNELRQTHPSLDICKIIKYVLCYHLKNPRNKDAILNLLINFQA